MPQAPTKKDLSGKTIKHTKGPIVGLGVMILKDRKVLLGKRRGSHGSGEYGFPGGRMEYMESFEKCAKRETREETGMEIENVRFLRLMNMKDYPPEHFVDIAFIADWKKGEPKVMEPEKVESWQWYDLDDLPQPLFHTEPSYFEAYATGRNYWDS